MSSPALAPVPDSTVGFVNTNPTFLPTRTTVATSPSIKELVTALAKSRKNFKPIKKTKFNPYHKSWYADLNDIISATADALAADGLVVVQLPNTSGTREVTVVTRLAHSSGEWIEFQTTGPAEKKFDKGAGTQYDIQTVGIAISYLRRYALQSILNLAADDDDDGNGLMTASDNPTPAPQRPGRRPTATPRQTESAPTKEAANAESKSAENPAAESAPAATPKSVLQEYGKKLKSYKQDSRLLKEFVYKRGGQNIEDADGWSKITKLEWEMILDELDKAKADGTIEKLLAGEIN